MGRVEFMEGLSLHHIKSIILPQKSPQISSSKASLFSLIDIFSILRKYDEKQPFQIAVYIDLQCNLNSLFYQCKLSFETNAITTTRLLSLSISCSEFWSRPRFIVEYSFPASTQWSHPQSPSSNPNPDMGACIVISCVSLQAWG